MVKGKEIRIKHKKESKKGDNGRVLIIGGSKEYAGAAALSGLACLRTGVDLVVVAAPEKAAWAINCYNPDLITKKLKGDYVRAGQVKKLVESAGQYDVVLIDGGLTLKAKEFVNKFVSDSRIVEKNKVIDADGIKALKISNGLKNTIITPHQKELEIFLKNNKMKTKAEEFKKLALGNKKRFMKLVGKDRRLNVFLESNVILLKGRIDKIISNKKIVFNKTGNEGMSVGGTGDVLAGLVTGFLAQTKDMVKSASWGAEINGKLGDRLKIKKGYSFIASDLIKDKKFFEKVKKRCLN